MRARFVSERIGGKEGKKKNRRGGWTKPSDQEAKSRAVLVGPSRANPVFPFGLLTC